MAFALIGVTWWQLLTAAVLGVLSTQVAFLGHDAGHKQVARTRRVSYLLGLLHGNLAVGLSFGWWLDKHNRHHARPNHAELDPDVAPTGPLIPFPEQGAGRRGLLGWATRNQAILFFPITLLEGLNLHVAIIRALRSGTIRARRLEATLLAVHLIAFIGVPFLLLDPWQALAFLGIHQAVLGCYMGRAFAPNHKGTPPITAAEERDYPLVNEFCAARGIRYTQTGLLTSHRLVLGHVSGVAAGRSATR